jgi:hypothetical protein
MLQRTSHRSTVHHWAGRNWNDFQMKFNSSLLLNTAKALKANGLWWGELCCWVADGFSVWPPRVEVARRDTCGQLASAVIFSRLAHSLSFRLLSRLHGTLRGHF